MSRIRISDIPVDSRMSNDEMKKVSGGWLPEPTIMPNPTQLAGCAPDPLPMSLPFGRISIEPNPTPAPIRK